MPIKALVAFSGSVEDDGRSYTESGMNSVGSDRTIGEYADRIWGVKPVRRGEAR